MIKKASLILIIISLGYTLYGQVETKYYKNADAIKHIKHFIENPKSTNKIELPTFDVQKLIDEDNINISNKLEVPYRFGKGFDVSITLANGDWIDVDEGRLWSMEFSSSKAYSINFIFDNLYLPDNAELYITNNGTTMLYGPVTSKENTKNGFFLTDLIMGEDVKIFLFEPYSEKGKSQLSIKRVVHAYKNIYSSFLYGNLNGSGSCENNIACWSDYSTESNAVALVLLADGSEFCSGSLLITTDKSFRPYFLTAFHCIDVDNYDITNPHFEDGILQSEEIDHAQNWLFKFQYKMTSCNGTSATTGITYNGSTFRAAWSSSDFALVELTNSPVGNSAFSWLGWDRSGNTPSSGVGIHHPLGDVMKISFETGQFQTSSWGGTNNHWLLSFDDGVVEKGSSGSPILDQNKRVVGQLHGNQTYDQNSTFCSQPRAEYGRLNLSWTGGGTNETRLSNWLDPSTTGPQTTNTLMSPYISGPTLLCSSGSSYAINYLPDGDTITWSSSDYITRVSSQGSNPCTFSGGGGSGLITATLHSGNTSVTLPHYIVWGGPPSTTSISGPSTTPPYNTKSYYAYADHTEGTSFNWWASPSSYLIWPYNTMANVYFTGTGYYMVYAQAYNSCGQHTPLGKMVNVAYSKSMIINPNPASNVVNVTIVDSSSLVTPNTTELSSIPPFSNPSLDSKPVVYNITVINTMGVPVYSTKSYDKLFTIPVRNLINGNYYITVNDGTKVFSKLLIVNHN